MQDQTKYWDDPESAWSVGVRRNVRKFKLSIVGVVLAVMLPLPAIYFLSSGLRGGSSAFSTSTKMLYLIVPFIMVLPLLKIIRMLKRERQLIEQLSKSKGWLCPVCRVVMSASKAEEMECSQCKRGGTIGSIVTYWESYGLDGTASIGWFSKYKSQGEGGLKRLQTEFARRMVENPTFPAIYFICIFFIFSIVFGLFRSRSLISSMLDMAPMMIFISGFAFIGIGYAKRKGMTMHCVACEYQQAPIGKASDRCPECGADWKVAGAIVQGHKIRTQRHYVIGSALILVWVLLLYGPLAGSSWKVKILPTNSLIHDAVSGGYIGDVWPELITRTLSPDQMNTLVEGMIDQLINEKYMSSEGRVWLFSTASFTSLQAGRLTDALIDRRFQEDYIHASETAWLFTIATFTPVQTDRLTEALIDRQFQREYADATESTWLFQTASFTPEQELRLQEGLLDQRTREGSISIAGGLWLDIQVTAGMMPSDLVDRYYEESFDLGMAGPAQTHFGETVSVKMSVKTRTIRTLAGLDLFVFLGDYFVNGHRVEDSREARVKYVSLIGNKSTSLTWTVDGTEDISVTREVWVAINPTSLQGSIQWQEDNTPLIPPGVIWSRKITLQHDIEIID